MMLILRNAVALIVLCTSATVSLACLVFSFYMLTTSKDSNLYVSLASSIISFWLGVSSTFVHAVTGEDIAAPVLPA